MALLRRTFVPLFLQTCLLSWTAWAKVNVRTHKSVEVYLGESAQMPCQYNFTNANNKSIEPNFVMIQWFVRVLSTGTRTRIAYFDNFHKLVDNYTDFSDRLQAMSDQQGTLLILPDVRLSDEREFFCQVNGLSFGSAEGRTHLRVFAPPEAPVIEGIVNGISVTNEAPSKVASCEARNGFPKPNITWYKNSIPLKSAPGNVNVLTLVTRESSGFYSVQSTLEYKVAKEDKDARFSCEVSFFAPRAIRTVESTGVSITVHYPTSMVELWKELPQGLVKEGDTVELRCQGDGNPPPTFIFNREQELDVDLESSGDVLILSPVSRKDGGIYQCRPLQTDSYTEIKGEVQLTVHYLDPAVVVPKDSEVMLRGEDLTATCNALSSLKTATVWYKDGQQVGKGNTLHLKDATYETTGEYVCEVSVPSLPALHTSGTVHIIVQGGPQLVGGEQEVQLVEAKGGMVNLSCEAQGHPLPSISWTIIGSQNWQEVVNKPSEHMAHSVVSVKVTSDLSAKCNVSNDLGTEVKVFSIKANPRMTQKATPFFPAEGSGVIIMVIILCLLLLATLGSVLYFLHKKGKIPCGRSGKTYITKEKTAKDEIVVEMKSNAENVEAVLLKVNGDKNGPNGQ